MITVSSIGLVVGSLLFLIIGLASEPREGFIAIVYMGIGAVYYGFRKRFLNRQKPRS